MFSDDAVELQQKPGVLPRNRAPRKKVKKVLGGDIDEKFQARSIKESLVDNKKRSAPGEQPEADRNLFTGQGDNKFNLLEWSSQVFSAGNGIETTTKALLMALGVAMNDEGICRITYKEIKERAAIKSDTTISKHLKIAIDAGWISVVHDEQPEGEHWLVYRARAL